jgi:hypothetical protein
MKSFVLQSAAVGFVFGECLSVLKRLHLKFNSKVIIPKITSKGIADIQGLLLQYYTSYDINPLTPELNPSAQRCMTRFFTVDFAS